MQMQDFRRDAMKIFKMDDNFYLRYCFFKREPQVPTQRFMKHKMFEPLALVYFQSMNYKLKVLAGLEPPMQGGGSDWYMPPDDLLQGRAVIKPIKNEYLKKLGFLGIDFFSERLVANFHREMEAQIQQTLLENDNEWKSKIVIACQRHWEENSKHYAKRNTTRILQAYSEFCVLYTTSITKMEGIIFKAAQDEINRVRDEAHANMSEKYEVMVKQQATELYEAYTNKLAKEKERLKNMFIENVEKSRAETTKRVHDMNVDRQVAIEKLRHLLECQNLACQIYVALKEREECDKIIQEQTHEHKKTVKFLSEQINWKNVEIQIQIDKEKSRREFIQIWEKKVCHVIKKFQLFVSYCLKTFPDHAEFFINMERLMLLQLSQVLEQPDAPSIIVPESDGFHTPVPQPHPFVLFGDIGTKSKVNSKLCPKRCTSSASQLPVVVINKRCIYAACDNYELFTDKIKQFLDNRHEGPMVDEHKYDLDVPVKITPSQQRHELQQQGPLMQVLQKEMANLNEVSTECCLCKIPFCFCSPQHATSISKQISLVEPTPSPANVDSGHKIDPREMELQYQRDPKIKDYIKHVKPVKCKCPKTAKKHLMEHLPAYMRNTSKFTEPDLPNYKPCNLETLKSLVKQARGKPPPPPSPPIKEESRTKDVNLQATDASFECICDCYSDDEIQEIFKRIRVRERLYDKADTFEVVGATLPNHLGQTDSAFTAARTRSLRKLMDVEPELLEIFMNKDCDYPVL